MIAWLDAIVAQLAWTTAAVSLAALLGAGLLRWFRVRSPHVHRTVWLLVLLEGLILFRLPIDLPLGPPQSTSQRIAARTVQSVDAVAALRDSADIEPLADERLDPDAEASLSAPASAMRWRTLLGIVWLTGIGCLIVHLVWRYIVFFGRLPRPIPGEASWEEELQAERRRMKVRPAITLHLTERIGPAVCWKPGGYRLLVPEALWRQLNAAQREAVLRHELAHVARGDLWTSLLARLLVLPQWFNPLAWWAVRRYEECAEWACDDLALGAEPEEAFDYARTLLALGEESMAAPALPHVAARGGAMSARIKRLLNPFPRKESIMKRMFLLVLVGVISALGLLQLRVVSADPPAISPRAAEFDAQADKIEPQTEADAVLELQLPVVSGDSESRAPGYVDIAVPSVKTERVVRYHSIARPASSSAGQEAVIDLSKVFKRYGKFLKRRDELKMRVAALDAESKKKRDLIAELNQRLKAVEDPKTKDTLEKSRAVFLAEIQAAAASSRRELILAEAKIYHESYEEVRAEVARYAWEHGIRTVRKSSAVVGGAEEVDLSDPQAVIARINREIIYSEPLYLDITEEILARLNARDTAKTE